MTEYTLVLSAQPQPPPHTPNRGCWGEGGGLWLLDVEEMTLLRQVREPRVPGYSCAPPKPCDVGIGSGGAALLESISACRVKWQTLLGNLTNSTDDNTVLTVQCFAVTNSPASLLRARRNGWPLAMEGGLKLYNTCSEAFDTSSPVKCTVMGEACEIQPHGEMTKQGQNMTSNPLLPHTKVYCWGKCTHYFVAFLFRPEAVNCLIKNNVPN